MSGALPIRRKDFDVPRFLAFVAANGGEVGVPTNRYEVVRYRAHWRGTNKASVHIVYAKENGLLTFTGGSMGHYRAFLAGAPMEELPTEEKRNKPKNGSARRHNRRARLLDRDGNGCWFCGEPMDDDCTIEHLVPKSKGGRDALANYALAHRQCNADAADMPLVEKIAMRERLRAGTKAAIALAKGGAA